MLKLPAFKHMSFADGQTASIFQDDAHFWRFYVIPGFPTVRLDKNENPVFALFTYLLSDQSREEDPNMGRGGGYMVFDAELKLSIENHEKVIKELQIDVDDEWERLKALPNTGVRELTLGATFNDSISEHWGRGSMAGGPRASGETSSSTTLEMPGADTPVVPDQQPKVVIGEPLWVDGKVTMSAPETTALVTGKVAERRASLIGNNVAAFNLTLSPDGATFMKKALVNEDGTGGTDLSPIQVAYELTMLAKLPPAKMYVKFNTASVYHAVQELFHEHHNCSDDYFTSENMMSTAIEAGLVTIKIDMGGVTDDEMEQMLTQQAMNTVQTMLANRFANKEREPLEEWGTEDVAESSKEIYRLKQVSEVDMTDFEQTVEINPTTEYTIAPQGTLSTFFRGRTDMDAFVRELDLNDPFFTTLKLSARAFAKWQEDFVDFVELHVEYKHDGQLKTNTFTFTPAESEPQTWDPSLIDGNREYRYRYRVAFQGQEAGDWSKWEKSTTRDLNVAVESPGVLDVTVSGVGLNFEKILDAVLVHLRYSDRRNDVEMTSQSLLLSNERGSGQWKRNLFAPWDKPVEYRMEYLLKNGKNIETTWKKTDGPTQNILVRRPEVDSISVPIVPTGDWTGVVQSVVSLRYQDGDSMVDEQYKFVAESDFQEWEFLPKSNAQSTFEYKILASFDNEDDQVSEWITGEVGEPARIRIERPPRLEVKISGQTIDFASTPVVQIDLTYRSPDGAVETDSYTLQDAENVHTWSIPIQDDSARSYEYQVTYFPIEGDPVVRDPVTTEDELIMVTRYSIPKVGAEFRPVLQDFVRTPAVEVDLTYDDPQRNVHEAMTLVFTEKVKQSWFLPINDEAPKKYKMSIKWHMDDGSETTIGPIELAKPVVVLPRPKVTAEA